MVANGLGPMRDIAVSGPLRRAPVARHLRRRRPGGPFAGRVAASAGRRARRRRRLPAPELGRGRHHVLGRGLPRRRRRADRPLLRRPRRSTTSSAPPHPQVVVTPDRFGHNDHLAIYDDAARRRPGPHWLVVGSTPAARSAARRAALRVVSSMPSPSPSRPSVDPDAPAIIGVHVGHDARPEGCRPLASHDRVRDPPTRLHVPHGRAAADHRRAGRSLHRDGQRLSGAAAPRSAGQPDRRLGPGRDPAADARPRASA